MWDDLRAMQGRLLQVWLCFLQRFGITMYTDLNCVQLLRIVYTLYPPKCVLLYVPVYIYILVYLCWDTRIISVQVYKTTYISIHSVGIGVEKRESAQWKRFFKDGKLLLSYPSIFGSEFEALRRWCYSNPHHILRPLELLSLENDLKSKLLPLLEVHRHQLQCPACVNIQMRLSPS